MSTHEAYAHRPFDSIIATLDDNFGPSTNAGHPPKKAVGVDYLVAIHKFIGTMHCGPQPGIRVVLDVSERYLKRLRLCGKEKEQYANKFHVYYFTFLNLF